MRRPQKTLLTLFLSFALASIFLVFAVFPLLKSIAKTTEVLQTQKQKFSELEASQKALEDFRRFKTANTDQFSKLKSFLVDTENPSSFFAFLENLADSQLFSLRIVPQEPKTIPGDLWPSIDFQVSSRTSFPKLFAFLEKLETGPYLLSIQNLQATQKEGPPAGEAGEVEFSLFFRAYGK